MYLDAAACTGWVLGEDDEVRMWWLHAIASQWKGLPATHPDDQAVLLMPVGVEVEVVIALRRNHVGFRAEDGGRGPVSKLQGTRRVSVRRTGATTHSRDDRPRSVHRCSGARVPRLTVSIVLKNLKALASTILVLMNDVRIMSVATLRSLFLECRGCGGTRTARQVHPFRISNDSKYLKSDHVHIAKSRFYYLRCYCTVR
jgi:hypothetical protein